MADCSQRDYLPRVTLIVPVKGPDYGLMENLAALASLDYPDYELIVAAAVAGDIPPGVVPARARVVCAGKDEGKIGNLVAALEAAALETEVFAFADSDGVVAPGWLRALVAPLSDPRTGAATGYRCHLPEKPALWSALRAAWDSGILGACGPGPRNLVWGGAMALRKTTFHEIGVLEEWRASVSDDYAVRRAVARAGMAVRFAPGALAVNASPIGAGECLGWIRRQLVLTRVYAPGLWWRSFAVSLAYCGSLAAAIAARAPFAAGALLALWFLKGHIRGRLAAIAVGKRRAWFLTWLAPAATALWLCGHVASLRGRSIEWRGRRYRL